MENDPEPTLPRTEQIAPLQLLDMRIPKSVVIHQIVNKGLQI